MINYNIECENTYTQWPIEESFVIENAKKIFNYYMLCPEIVQNSCLKDYQYNTLAFDFVLSDNNTTYEINKNYRNKDYPADIITFAVFADSEETERFVLDGEINLGEIIISLEKMISGSEEKNVARESELLFFISHGILHLLGFDHQTTEEFDFVVKYQKKALESLKIIYDKV